MESSRIIVWHPANHMDPGHMLVIDGNHRVKALQQLYSEHVSETSKSHRSLLYMQAVVLHPSTPWSAIMCIVAGILWVIYLCSLL